MYKEKILMDALKQIEAGVSPSNEREAFSWIGTAKEIASTALASYAEQAPLEKPEGPWHIREEVSRGVPETGDMSVDVKSIITDGKAELYTYDDGDLQPIVEALNASECEFKVNEAARLQVFTLSHEVEELRHWKKEAMEVYNPIHEYAEGHPDIKLGSSIVSFVVNRAKEYDKMQPQVTGKSAVQPTTEQLRDELDDKRVLRFSNLTEDIWHLVRKQSAEHLLDKYDIFPKGEAGKQPEQQPVGEKEGE